MATGTGGCINHPGIEAVARCKMCAKGLCAACRVIGPSGIFCSETCKTRHEEFVKRAAGLERKQATGSLFLTRVRNLVGWILVVLVVVLGAGIGGRIAGFRVPLVSDITDRVLGLIGM